MNISQDEYVIVHGSPRILTLKEGDNKHECIAKDDKFQITKNNLSVLQRKVFKYCDFEGEYTMEDV